MLTEEEKVQLYHRHGELVDKKFGTGLSAEECTELEEVRRKLSADEHIQLGPARARLEEMRAEVERIHKEVAGLLEKVKKERRHR